LYLSEGISDKIIDEVSYMLDVLLSKKGIIFLRRGILERIFILLVMESLICIWAIIANSPPFLETLDTDKVVGSYG
jgi:hypothetical protein